jgi:hypothetical protein
MVVRAKEQKIRRSNRGFRRPKGKYRACGREGIERHAWDRGELPRGAHRRRKVDISVMPPSNSKRPHIMAPMPRPETSDTRPGLHFSTQTLNTTCVVGLSGPA